MAGEIITVGELVALLQEMPQEQRLLAQTPGPEERRWGVLGTLEELDGGTGELFARIELGDWVRV